MAATTISQGRDGSKNLAIKINLRTLSLYCDNSYSLTLSNIGEPSSIWIPRIKFSFKKRNKFPRRVFTPSIKRTTRQFYVEVVQKRQRNVLKSVMHVQICFSPTIFFLWQKNLPSMMTRRATQNSTQSVSSMLADDLCLLYCRLKSEVCMMASLNMLLMLI